MSNYQSRLCACLAGASLFLVVSTVNSQEAQQLQFLDMGWGNLSAPVQALAAVQANSPPAAGASAAPLRIILTRAGAIPNLPAETKELMRTLARQGVPLICQGGERELASLLGLGVATESGSEESFFVVVWQARTVYRACFLLAGQSVQTFVQDNNGGELTAITDPGEEATGTTEENMTALLGQALSWVINLDAEAQNPLQAPGLLPESDSIVKTMPPKLGTDTGAWNAATNYVFYWSGITQGKINAVLGLTVNAFKIRDGHSDQDWYLVDCKLQHEINKASPYEQWHIPALVGNVGFYVQDRSLKIERAESDDGSLVEYGPTTTVGTSETGFTLGASLDTGGPGVNASYSQSFSNPDVGITDTSSPSDSICNWREDFVCPKGIYTPWWAAKWPTPPSKASWYADYCSIWRTTNTSQNGGLKLKVTPSANMYRDYIYFWIPAGVCLARRSISYNLGNEVEITVFKNLPPDTPMKPSLRNPVAAGQTVAAETSGGLDPDGDVVTFKFDWGDQEGPYGEPQQRHVYMESGVYNVRVKAADSYGHESPWSESFPVTVVGSAVLNVKTLRVNLNFAKSYKDTCALTATFAGADGFQVAGKTVTLTVGDIETQFVLDAKGKGRNGNSTLRFSYNKKKNLWTAQANLQRGEYEEAWSGYGLVNATIPRPGRSVVLPVGLIVEDKVFAGQKALTFTARLNKSGLGK